MTTRQRWTMLATVLGSSIVFLDGTVVNLALKTIGEDLPSGILGVLEGQAYITNGYLAVLAALLILGGAISDRYGRKRVFAIGLLGFGGTSILCGLSPTMEALVLFRLLQGAAAALGRKFQYRKALDALAKADAALARSRQLRDRLANTTDVDILSRWIDRNATFDAAVRKVWTMLVKSKGKINKDVRTAFDELRIAQAALPPDSRAMIIIMAEVARGGLNQAVIAIEEARGRLSAATDAIGG